MLRTVSLWVRRGPHLSRVIAMSVLSLAFIALIHLFLTPTGVCFPVSDSIPLMTLSLRSFQIRKADSVARILYSLVAPSLFLPRSVVMFMSVAARTSLVRHGFGHTPPFLAHSSLASAQTSSLPTSRQSKRMWSMSSDSPQAWQLARISRVGMLSQ